MGIKALCPPTSNQYSSLGLHLQIMTIQILSHIMKTKKHSSLDS